MRIQFSASTSKSWVGTSKLETKWPILKRGSCYSAGYCQRMQLPTGRMYQSNADTYVHMHIIKTQPENWLSESSHQSAASKHAVLVTQSRPAVGEPEDCGLPGSPVHGIPRPEYRSGWPFPSPGDLPEPGINPGLPHCRQSLYCLATREAHGVVLIRPSTHVIKAALNARWFQTSPRALRPHPDGHFWRPFSQRA